METISCYGNTRIVIKTGDITKEKVEAIVNAANSRLLGGGGGTVGPVWQGGVKNEDKILERSFLNSLQRALEKRVKTIAFPAVSTGAYGFPVDQAARISVCAIKKFLNTHPDSFQEIRMVLFGENIYKHFEKAIKNCFQNLSSIS